MGLVRRSPRSGRNQRFFDLGRPLAAGVRGFDGPIGTRRGYDWTVVSVEFERVEVLELLGMTLAHLNDAEVKGDLSPRVPLLMAIRDKLARALQEEK